MLKTTFLRCIHKIARDQRGVSAIEFAILAPLMIGLYLGCVEISNGVAADRKVRLIASALANLGAQATVISSDDMSNILDASTAIISPYDAGKLNVTVSCLKVDGNGAAKVAWSVTRGGTALAAGGTYAFDSTSAPLAVPDSSLVLGEASYAYTPAVAYTITGTLTLSEKMYMSPRVSAPVYNNQACG